MPRTPVHSVPSELVCSGYAWESIRRGYFTRHGQQKRAKECGRLAVAYANRLSAEHGIEVERY